MSLTGPIIGIADVHQVDGSRADDSCDAGLLWAIDQALTLYQPALVAFLGDILDGVLAPWDLIIDTHAATWDEVDRRLADAHVPAVLISGNHEGGPAAALVSKLRRVMPRCQLHGHDGQLNAWGWTLLHGHEWDPWCHGPQAHLSSLATTVAGLLERVIPGFDESMLNPTRLTSPARAKRASLQTAILEAADAYVASCGGRVLHGHTHRRRISSDRLVVCAGTCTKGRGEFAAVWADGAAVLHEMRV